VQYFAQLGTEIEALDATGDIVTEDLNRILASVCQGDLSLIKQLIEDSKQNEFVHSAALKSLVVLYNGDQLTREELITYFQTLINDKLEQEEEHGKFVLSHKPFTRKSLLVNSGHLFAVAV
jgi:hypothetical protein